MPAKRRARQLAVLVAVVTLLATAPGPALGDATVQAARTRLARRSGYTWVATWYGTGRGIGMSRPGRLFRW